MNRFPVRNPFAEKKPSCTFNFGNPAIFQTRGFPSLFLLRFGFVLVISIFVYIIPFQKNGCQSDLITLGNHNVMGKMRTEDLS